MAVVMIIIMLVFSYVILIGIQSYFNMKEIDSLVSGAKARNMDYSLEIHNKWTHDYSFKIVD